MSEILIGETFTSKETTAVGFYTPEDARELDVIESHHQRIADGLNPQETPYVR